MTQHPQDLTIETYIKHIDKYIAETPAEPSGLWKTWMDV